MNNKRSKFKNPLHQHQAQRKGSIIEQLVSEYLTQNGLNIITQNYHCRAGEIDLVMTQANNLVFIEVKYRKKSIEDALESVTALKQKRIIKAAEHFLLCHQQYHSHNCRFDVVAVTRESQQFTVHWLKNAFTL